MRLKTTSIIECLEAENREPNAIDTLIISKFDVIGEPNLVDFDDLKNFINLRNLILNECTINEEDMFVVTTIKTLTYLNLSRCSFADNMSHVFHLLPVDNLILNRVEHFDFNILNGMKFNVLRVIDMNYKSSSVIVNKLDLTKSKYNVRDLEGATVKTLVINDKQYEKDYKFYQSLGIEVIVMENGTNFISKKVGASCD